MSHDIDLSYFTDAVQLGEHVVQLSESKSVTLAAIEESNRRVKFHVVIYPKHNVSSVNDLVTGDILWLQGMKQMAEKMLLDREPELFKNGNYRLIFSTPGDHAITTNTKRLHLHVLAPNEPSWSGGQHKMNPKSGKCILLDKVLEALGGGEQQPKI
jgi:hypothetical protein